MEKENRRVRYTKMVLRESLLSLLEKKPISKITVSELCQIADINRGTFYSYYQDVFDLLEKIEDEFYLSIFTSIAQSKTIKTNTDLLCRIFEAIAGNGDLCRVLFGEYGDKAFLQKCCSIQRDRIVSEWRSYTKEIDENQLEYIYSYMVDGSVGILQRWIKNGFAEKPGDLAAFVVKLNEKGLQAFLNIN